MFIRPIDLSKLKTSVVSILFFRNKNSIGTSTKRTQDFVARMWQGRKVDIYQTNANYSLKSI